MNWSKVIEEKYAKLPIIRTRYPRAITDNNSIILSSGQKYLNFISNDYLGLSNHQVLKDALITAASSYGTGSTGAASLSGYSQEQELLTREIANWLKMESALICNSGYTLNWGLYQPLVNQESLIWLDENCHASHIDGVLFSRAKFRRFNQNSIDNITKTIKDTPNKYHLIVSEGIFSMDGSSTHLNRLIEIKQNFPDQVLLIIDDAHGLGTLGSNAWGQLELSGYQPTDIDLLIGTFGKSFGSQGAFLAGKKMLTDYLQQSIRSQIYTTCLPPAIHAASRAALKIICGDIGQQLRLQLKNNISLFRQLAQQYQLEILDHNNTSPIQLIIGYPIAALRSIVTKLKEAEIWLSLIQYPTVTQELPRLRISLSANHTNTDIKYLCYKLKEAIHEYS